MEKKKERSSRQRLRIDIGQEGGEEDGNLLLANPMAGGEVSSPHSQIPSKAKSRPKSPSLLRFFVRGTRKVNEDIEEAAGSDHEDGLSASNSQCSQCSLPDHLSPPSSAPLRFDRNIAAYVTMPRRKRRAEKRDSGFHSERSDSASRDKDQLSASPEDMQPSPSPIEDRAVGMEALEALHNQIQILVKQDCPEEDAPLANLHEAVIASLRHQLEEVQQTLDFLRRSDQNLRLALRDADHRALEAETKLFKANERNQRLEHKLLMMAHKYQQLKAHLVHSNHALCSPLSSRRHITSPNKSAYYSPQTQRVHRVSSADSSVASHRPSSAQGTRDSVSMETCV